MKLLLDCTLHLTRGGGIRHLLPVKAGGKCQSETTVRNALYDPILERHANGRRLDGGNNTVPCVTQRFQSELTSNERRGGGLHRLRHHRFLLCFSFNFYLALLFYDFLEDRWLLGLFGSGGCMPFLFSLPFS